jgi:CTP:molybdopterin cytidylyltransferase MocA
MTGGVAGVILAAGGGTRLGGRAKALLRVGGELFVERAVRTLRAGGCDPVVVVLGHQADVILATNPDWPTGLGSSLRAGLAAVPAGCAAAAVLQVDQPFVSAEAVRAVLAAHLRGADIAAASYAGRRGHPVLFAARHWPEVAASALGDRGARTFLAEHAAEVVTVPCDGLGDSRDVDTPDDLRTL